METTPPGRREAHKRATRAAIKQAADRLIAAQGFEQTTIREIAEAAQVTERTFYRYFDGKEGLVADEADRWLGRLCDAIVARPASEPPLESVRAAALGLAAAIETGQRAQPHWLLADRGGAVAALRRTGVKPLLRLESRIAEALAARRDGTGGEVVSDQFELAVLGRVAAALLRSVMIERRRLLNTGGEVEVPAGALIERAFAAVSGPAR